MITKGGPLHGSHLFKAHWDGRRLLDHLPLPDHIHLWVLCSSGKKCPLRGKENHRKPQLCKAKRKRALVSTPMSSRVGQKSSKQAPADMIALHTITGKQQFLCWIQQQYSIVDFNPSKAHSQVIRLHRRCFEEVVCTFSAAV